MNVHENWLLTAKIVQFMSGIDSCIQKRYIVSCKESSQSRRNAIHCAVRRVSMPDIYATAIPIGGRFVTELV